MTHSYRFPTVQSVILHLQMTITWILVTKNINSLENFTQLIVLHT